jgi:hypothetical protein
MTLLLVCLLQLSERSLSPGGPATTSSTVWTAGSSGAGIHRVEDARRVALSLPLSSSSRGTLCLQLEEGGDDACQGKLKLANCQAQHITDAH